MLSDGATLDAFFRERFSPCVHSDIPRHLLISFASYALRRQEWTIAFRRYLGAVRREPLRGGTFAQLIRTLVPNRATRTVDS
jgi:hypothetical protein